MASDILKQKKKMTLKHCKAFPSLVLVTPSFPQIKLGGGAWWEVNVDFSEKVHVAERQGK